MQTSTAQTRQRLLAGTVLFLTGLAFLPSILNDYATMDQWRAFRYSLQETSSGDRFAACADMVSDFYAMTGRPLVWQTECVEHATVANFEDFSQLRVPMLVLVLVAVVAVGWAFNTIIKRPSLAYAGAALAIMTPAFSFMALQGVTAAAVLATVPLSAASFVSLSRANDGSRTLPKQVGYYLSAAALFFFALLIYPAWAFLVVSFAVVAFLLSVDQSWRYRYTHLGIALTVVALTGLLYYVGVRIWVSSNFTQEMTSSLGSYEVNADLSVSRLLARFTVASDYMWSMPPTNVSALGGVSGVLIAAFTLLRVIDVWRNAGWASTIQFLAAMALSIFLMLSFAIGPWLVSGMSRPETRHLLVWSVFVAGVFVGLYQALEAASARLGVPRIVVRSLGTIFLLVTAMLQFKFVGYETHTSSREFQVYQDAIRGWVDRQGWREGRLIVVLRPPDATRSTTTNARPVDVADALGTIQTRTDGLIPFARGSAWLASADNPVSIPWMVTAALREQADRLPLSLKRVVDCGADQTCMSSALQDPDSIVIGYADPLDALTVPRTPLLIDVSKLTSQPNMARVTLGAPMRVSSSSQLQDFGPERLLSSGQPGWHAEVPVQYPQFVLFDFGSSRNFQSVTLTPQDGHPERMPSSINVELSKDGNDWKKVMSAKQNCPSPDLDYWRVPFDTHHSARWWRVEVTENCGDSEYLTLKGLTFD